MQTLIGLVTGIVVGAIFAAVGAKARPPPTMAGVAGVVGIALGYYVVYRLKGSP